MATPSQRRAAQRATAKAVREHRRILPSRITSRARRASELYAKAVMRGDEPRPEPGSLEARALARWASLARWHKADPAYLKAFQEYFYHDEKGKTLVIEGDEDEE
jgi:hypothetical protein